MKGTIHYIGDFSYIKDEGHLKEAINYITRNFKLDSSLTTIDKEKRNVWIERAKYEKSKRKDSQLALRFYVALPNDKRDDANFREKVKNKLVEIFNIPEEHLDIAFHLDSESNYHAHILIYPRGKDGKKLRLKKNDLTKIHREWDKFLQTEGYNVKKNGDNKKKPIWQYMKEKAKEMGYIPIPPVAIDEELLTKGKERFLKEMKRQQIEIKEADIPEDMVEKEAIKIAEYQTIRKLMRTKEYLKQNQPQKQKQPQNQPQLITNQKLTNQKNQPANQNQKPQPQKQNQPSINNQQNLQDSLQDYITRPRMRL